MVHDHASRTEDAPPEIEHRIPILIAHNPTPFPSDLPHADFPILRRAPATIWIIHANNRLVHSGIAANSPKPATHLIRLPLDHLRVTVGMTQHGHSFSHCQELFGVNKRIFGCHE